MASSFGKCRICFQVSGQIADEVPVFCPVQTVSLTAHCTRAGMFWRQLQLGEAEHGAGEHPLLLETKDSGLVLLSELTPSAAQ